MAADEIDHDRRIFLSRLGHAALLTGAAGLGVLSLDFLLPNILLEPPAEVNVGRPEEFAPGTVTLLSKHRVFIVRSPTGPFHALSAVCTHLGCMTGYRASSRLIACPCHGSVFDPADGSVVGGPAPIPLPTLALKLSREGFLWVNRTSRVEPGTILKV